MRVALVGFYPPDTSRIEGGIAAVTFYLAQGLSQRPDIELHVISTTKEMERDSVYADGNATIHQLVEPKRRIVPNTLRSIGRIRREIEKIEPDVVHSQLVTGTAAGLKAGCPTIHTIHGIVHKEVRFGRSFTEKLVVSLGASIGKKGIAGVKHAIATSNYAARAYEGFTNAKLHFISNPIEDRFFELENLEVPNRMLSVSVITPRKNVVGLMRAFDLIRRADPAAELLVIGKATIPDYYAEVQACVASLGLEQAVTFLGYVSQDDVGRHFSEAAIVGLFSLEETAPMAVAQAMCAGKPVVASAAGGTPDLVTDGETGFLVPVGDEKAFAEASIRLLSDPELRRKMGARARKVAEERFRKEVVAARMVEVYKEALAD